MKQTLMADPPEFNNHLAEVRYERVGWVGGCVECLFVYVCVYVYVYVYVCVYVRVHVYVYVRVYVYFYVYVRDYAYVLVLVCLYALVSKLSLHQLPHGQPLTPPSHAPTTLTHAHAHQT